MTDLATHHWKDSLTAEPLDAEPGRALSEGRAKRPLEVARTRLLVAGAVFALCFAVLGFRLVGLALFEDAPDSRASAHRGAEGVSVARADLTDRNGTLLATNLPTVTLYADPSLVIDANDAINKLQGVLPELSREWLLRQLDGKGRYVRIKRSLTPDQEYEINRLGLPGFGFEREERRVYPQGPLLAHVLGYAGVDNHGLAGLERGLDGRLDALADAGPVALSLDISVQHVLNEEVASAIQEFDGIGGAGIVLDVETGEILAMTSLPTFDPNADRKPDDPNQFNRATKGVYEFGSTFKSFTLAMALDYGVVGLGDGYDASAPIRVSRYTINDDHPKNRWLSVPEIFMYSSNIGAAKMALDVGAARQRAFLEKLGMLQPLTLEVPEIGSPLAPSPKDWRELSTMTIAYGHGVAVTPLHLASAMAALVNGGILHPPTLLRRAPGVPAPGVRVIKPETSEIMRRLLRLVVTDGTGKKAAAPGYLVGGKTGTSDKYNSNALLTTFVGAFPMNAPRYVVLVSIDEPKGNKSTFGFATAGWTAAPSVGRVVTRIAPLLGVEPVDEDAEPIRNELNILKVSAGAQLEAF
ncbi:MAG: peptidoglycan D,D-transpeptidase FtsI family protein [Alphaproteobacteria bacterium]